MLESRPSLKTTLVVYLLLLAIVALTTGLSFVDLGRWSVAAALVLAGVKAMLVALYFMHLRHGARLNWVLAGAGLYMLAILFLLTLNDLRTRVWSSSFPGG